MTEILNVWIQSVWFWVATYIFSMFFTYFLSVKFKWWNEGEDADNFFIVLVIMFPLLFLVIYMIYIVVNSIGSVIHKLATADHLTEDEQKELEKRQSK